MMPFAEPRAVRSPEDCWFYHVMDLPGFGTVGDQWDLRGRIDDYIGHVGVRGKRVLDVGTASGFLTFEMEKLGAEVVSFDADESVRPYLVPIKEHPFTTDRASFYRDWATGLDRLKNSYWLAHRLFASRARAAYGNVYDVPATLGEFDVAVIGQILVHLSDPIRALVSVMNRCHGQLVITEGMIDSDKPTAHLCGGRADPWAFWVCSTGLYREVLTMAGWRIERIEKARYRCVAAQMRARSLERIELTTIVATRA